MKISELRDLTLRELFILARDLCMSNLRITFKEPYETLFLYAKLPEDVTIDDAQELLEAAMSTDDPEPSFAETVEGKILRDHIIPVELQRFLVFRE